MENNIGHLDLTKQIPASIIFNEADIPAEWREPEQPEFTREDSDAVELDRR